MKIEINIYLINIVDCLPQLCSLFVFSLSFKGKLACTNEHFSQVNFTSVRTKTRKRRFQKFPLWKAFSVTVFTGCVWTERRSAKKKLRFRTKTDTCGRVPRFSEHPRDIV